MKRWTVRDRLGNEVYLTQGRWDHIVQPFNHPEMQDSLNPEKYRYVKAFAGLAEENTHVVAIVMFRFREGEGGRPVPNNYIVTA